jgi:hypothetical protein
MFKMPRRDPENGMRVWHVVFMVLTVALVSTMTFKAMGFLPGLILNRPIPAQTANEFAVFGTVIMTIMTTIMGTVFLFIPGPTRMREERRQILRQQILDYQEIYPDSVDRGFSEFMEEVR